MKLVACTTRQEAGADETRDNLDVRWHEFLESCGARALLLPNHSSAAGELMEKCDPAGLLLTGGGDIERVSGARSARDLVEELALAWAVRKARPVVGVCRGLQVLIAQDNGALQDVAGHVRTTHSISGAVPERRVNSFHHYGTRAASNSYVILARAPDGVVEMIRHRSLPWIAIGWHPERQDDFDPADVALFASAIHEGRCA